MTQLPGETHPGASGEQREALAWLTAAATAEAAERLAQPYVDAAAVLSSFDPCKIMPLAELSDADREDALLELINSSRPLEEGIAGRWQLEEDARREALHRLGNREKMRQARAANPEPASDPLQVGFDILIETDGLPELDTLTLEQLLGVERVAGWLDGILDGLPDRKKLVACIERERLFAPMRKLAGVGFVDREDQLRRLADYVGVLPPDTLLQSLRRGYHHIAYLIDQRPPLLIHGPGAGLLGTLGVPVYSQDRQERVLSKSLDRLDDACVEHR